MSLYFGKGVLFEAGKTACWCKGAFEGSIERLFLLMALVTGGYFSKAATLYYFILSRQDMYPLKKQISSTKYHQIMCQNKIIMYFHFNNVKTQEWHDLKRQLHEKHTLDLLIVNNRIAKKTYNKDTSIFPLKYTSHPKVPENSGQDLFPRSAPTKTQVSPASNRDCKQVQLPDLLDRDFYNWSDSCFSGPTVIIGCSDLKQVEPILNIIGNLRKFVFLGGLLENQALNCLDFAKLAKLDPHKVRKECIELLWSAHTKHISYAKFFLQSFLHAQCKNPQPLMRFLFTLNALVPHYITQGNQVQGLGKKAI